MEFRLQPVRLKAALQTNRLKPELRTSGKQFWCGAGACLDSDRFFHMAISFANRSNSDLLDENYARWRNDPASVDATWSAFFEGFELGAVSLTNGAKAAAPAPGADAPLQTRVDGLVFSYRTLGHTIAHTDPLAKQRPENPLLTLREFGFSEKNLDLDRKSVV